MSDLIERDVKTCAECGETKPLELFHKSKGGREPRCKSCRSIARKLQRSTPEAKARERLLYETRGRPDAMLVRAKKSKMEPRVPLTAEILRSLVVYDAETGVFTWRVRRAYKAAGSIAGNLNKSTGYWRIEIRKRIYRAHRLAFLYMTGAWPEDTIDHIDGDPLNNRWANLRPATRQQQMWNRPRQADNRSGYKCVRKSGSSGERPWSAHITVSGKTICLGFFSTPEEAHAAYAEAAKEHFGEFARAQ